MKPGEREASQRNRSRVPKFPWFDVFSFLALSLLSLFSPSPLSLSRSLSLACSLSRARSLSRVLALSRALSHTHTRSLSLTLTLSQGDHSLTLVRDLTSSTDVLNAAEWQPSLGICLMCIMFVSSHVCMCMCVLAPPSRPFFF